MKKILRIRALPLSKCGYIWLLWGNHFPSLDGGKMVTSKLNRVDFRYASVINFSHDVRGQGGGWEVIEKMFLKRKKVVSLGRTERILNQILTFLGPSSGSETGSRVRDEIFHRRLRRIIPPLPSFCSCSHIRTSPASRTGSVSSPPLVALSSAVP